MELFMYLYRDQAASHATQVDWIKHCFVTKFNHFSPDYYSKFGTVIAADIAGLHQPDSEVRDQCDAYMMDI
jgi:hypothetical protein